jgi:hypothetical protein
VSRSVAFGNFCARWKASRREERPRFTTYDSFCHILVHGALARHIMLRYDIAVQKGCITIFPFASIFIHRGLTCHTPRRIQCTHIPNIGLV